jgi:ribosomal protein S18 acetylase RimI-like enzyme
LLYDFRQRDKSINIWSVDKYRDNILKAFISSFFKNYLNLQIWMGIKLIFRFFESFKETKILQMALYDDPNAHVEELATLEGSPAGRVFRGWFNTENPHEYLLVRENCEGTQSIYFHPLKTDWSTLSLEDLMMGKNYVQTNLLGEKILKCLKVPFQIPHTVRYFHWKSLAISESYQIKQLGLDRQIEEKKEDGQLKELELRLKKGQKVVASAGSNLINSKTAMVGIGVYPDWRERGIAKILLGEVCQELLNRGIDPVYACDILNVPSLSLAKQFFEPHNEYQCLFIGDWQLERPSSASSVLPDSLFVC